MKKLLFILFLLGLAGCTNWEPCRPEIGSTREQVISHCGEPDKINRTFTGGLTEQWVYYYDSVWIGKRPDIATNYVYLRDGRVVGWQD